MSYTPPAGDSAGFSWVGYSADYTPPAGDSAGFSWADSGVTGSGAATVPVAASGSGAHGVAGSGAADTTTSASGTGTHESQAVEGAGAATTTATAVGTGAHGVAGAGASVTVAQAAGTGAHGVAGQGAGLVALPATAGQGAVGVGGSGAALTAPPAAEGVGQVTRYEYRGEVRKDGVLVDRTVRAHRLSDGAVLAEGATEGGRFRLHVGFTPIEGYTLALDLTAGATDYTPPISNHVVAELADDTA